MKNINFIPEKFNDIKLGYYQAQMNECSPNYPNKIIQLNTISINIPQTILFVEAEGFVPIIPVCASYAISLRRIYKYNYLAAKKLHIKKIEEEEIFTGEIVRKINYGMVSLLPPNYEEQQQRKRQMIEEAQSYGDDELGDGFGGANYININLMEYIDMPFVPGKYEVWLFFNGLESNRVIVEIVFEE